MPCSSRRPFEEVIEPLTTATHAQLLATLKSHSIATQHSRSPSQPRRQAKSKSPPFIEAALSSNLRPNATGIQTVEVIPESELYANHGTSVPRTAVIQSSKTKHSDSCSVTESIGTDDVQESLILRNHPDQPGTVAEALPDDTFHRKLDHGDTLQPSVSGRDSPRSRPVLRDLPTHQRPRSRNRMRIATHQDMEQTKRHLTGPLLDP
jgi:hypothetical protein